MSDAKSRFVYVTYIGTTAEKLWSALTTPEFVEKYWLGIRMEAEWKAGGAWKLSFPDGRVADSGEIVAFEPGRRLSIRWRNEWKPEMNAEGWSLCTMEIEPAAGAIVKLTVTHSIEREGSQFIEAAPAAGRRFCPTSSRYWRPARLSSRRGRSIREHDRTERDHLDALRHAGEGGRLSG